MMRIAQVAPCSEYSPKLYGGTERVISSLTEELVRLGHEVTLFASGDSETNARLVPACPRALWHDESCRETLPHHVRLMDLVFQDASALTSSTSTATIYTSLCCDATLPKRHDLARAAARPGSAAPLC
jgi:hypothetical protein